MKKGKKGLFLIITLFLVFIYSPSINSDTLISPQQKIKIFLEQLDSLDLVKQNLKRKGLDITEIEKEQAKLRDSVETIKKEINTYLTNRVPSNLEKTKRFLPFLKSPSDFFDLLIVLMGVLACLSGIFLIREIHRSIRLKKIKKVEKKEQQKATQICKPLPEYPQYDNIPQSIREYTNNKLSEEEEEEEENNNFDSNNNLENGQQEQQEDTKKTEQNEKNLEKLKEIQKEDISLEEKIIKAAKNGIEINNISKAFHISVDQISLILKIAESKYKKRGNN